MCDTNSPTCPLQSLLEETDIKERLPRVLELLKKEHLQAKLQQEIAGEVEKQVTDRNRQAMLCVLGHVVIT